MKRQAKMIAEARLMRWAICREGKSRDVPNARLIRVNLRGNDGIRGRDTELTTSHSPERYPINEHSHPIPCFPAAKSGKGAP